MSLYIDLSFFLDDRSSAFCIFFTNNFFSEAINVRRIQTVNNHPKKPENIQKIVFHTWGKLILSNISRTHMSSIDHIYGDKFDMSWLNQSGIFDISCENDSSSILIIHIIHIKNHTNIPAVIKMETIFILVYL